MATDPFSIAALGLGAAGSAFKFFGAQTQAGRIREQTAEQVRRQEAQAAQRVGEATAAAGASGFEFTGGSIRQHLDEMQQEFQRQIDWTRKVGRQQAKDVSTAGTLGLLSDLGGSMFSFGQANNWWRQAPSVGAGVAGGGITP